MNFTLIAAVASSLVAVTVVLNTYILNKVKPETKLIKGLVAFGGSTVVTLAVKFVPLSGIVSLLAVVGVAIDPIELPSDALTLNWLGLAGVDVFLFLMSGGVWDMSKLFGWRQSTKIGLAAGKSRKLEHFRTD